MSLQQINKNRREGMLEVICGPMFSGKSEELIRRLRRAQIARQKVITFKPSIDTRNAIEYVVSHNGTKFSAQSLTYEDEIRTITRTHDIDVIGIDETQFFSNNIISIICELVNEGRRIIIAGLDRDFRGAPFGCMPILLAIANKVTKLQAICTQCGNEAHLTQRLVNGNPARHDDPIVLIGAHEAYQARCSSCYTIDKMVII